MNHRGRLALALVVALGAAGCPSGDENSTDASGTTDGSSSGDSSGDASSGDTAGDTSSDGVVTCAPGYTCTEDPDSNAIWVMKNDGNVNGPTCQRVCEAALGESCGYRACDAGRPVDFKDFDAFAPIASGLGFTCREGGCWWPDAPADGLYLVSIETDGEGRKSCYFPTQSALRCDTHPGNANCFGERYAAVCPCVPKALDDACAWECPPHNTTKATWKTGGSSCLERINYWRKRACEEGWVECPPAGLPPMVECTACHECANSEAQHDSESGAHDSFKRCGESAQGEGGGATCADVIDSFVAERAPDEDGVMRCEGHCGPILAPGCQSFSWGKAADSNFHTLNWGSCNADTCQSYCSDHPGDCFTHDSSPPLTCEDPDADKEPGPEVLACVDG
ncbi:MAG: hypothetical protein KC636_32105 [Myxococcales bacterium]|nr:hypothetical protein [Myxococcales bacterium]